MSFYRINLASARSLALECRLHLQNLAALNPMRIWRWFWVCFFSFFFLSPGISLRGFCCTSKINRRQESIQKMHSFFLAYFQIKFQSHWAMPLATQTLQQCLAVFLKSQYIVWRVVFVLLDVDVFLHWIWLCCVAFIVIVVVSEWENKHYYSVILLHWIGCKPIQNGNFLSVKNVSNLLAWLGCLFGWLEVINFHCQHFQNLSTTLIVLLLLPPTTTGSERETLRKKKNNNNNNNQIDLLLSNFVCVCCFFEFVNKVAEPFFGIRIYSEAIICLWQFKSSVNICVKCKRPHLRNCLCFTVLSRQSFIVTVQSVLAFPFHQCPLDFVVFFDYFLKR